MRPTSSLVALLLLSGSLAAAQAPHPGAAHATAALHEDLMRSTASSRALLPLVSGSIAAQTQSRGLTFGDADVKVNAAHATANTCLGTIYSFWAMVIIQYATFGSSGIWTALTELTLQAALAAAMNQMINSLARFTLEELADKLVEELEPYRNTSQFSRLDAYLFALQVLANTTNTLPTTRFSTSATFTVRAVHTPQLEPTKVKNRFDLVSSITTHTSVKTAGIGECYAWYLANIYSLMIFHVPVPEEWFYLDTSLDRTWAPNGQPALIATVMVENAPQPVAGELTLRRTGHTVTGAPRDNYRTSAFASEVPPTLRYGGSDLEFKLQVQRHLLSVLEKLVNANYDGFTVNELLLDDRLNADTFFQKSDVTSTARFNLDPQRGTQAEAWTGPNTQLGFVQGGPNLGSLSSIPNVFMAQLNAGAVNASAISPALAPYAAALVAPEASLVAPAEKGLYVLRGLEQAWFTNPVGSAYDDVDTTVVAGLNTPAAIFDLRLKARVLSFVAPPRLYEWQGKRFVEVRVVLRLDLSSVERSLTGSQTGQVTFTTEVREELFKVYGEQDKSRATARWELRLAPGKTVVTTTLDPQPLLTSTELGELLADLLHPRLSRAIQTMAGNRVGNLHDLGGWGGLQSMVRHQLQQTWVVGNDGPGQLSGFKLREPSVDVQLDFGVRAPRPYPDTVPLNAQGDVVSATATEHLPAEVGELPRADYAVRIVAAGAERPFVVVCKYSFMAPNGTLPPVRVHVSYAYATTRLLRGDKKQVLTDAQFFNPDTGTGPTAGTGKLGATNSNLARRIFDELNPAIPDICKIRQGDTVVDIANFAPNVDPQFTFAVYGEYDHGLEKSDVCNPLVSFDRVPYLPRIDQPMPIAPSYTGLFDLTGAAYARKHLVSSNSCAPVDVLVVEAGGGGELIDASGTGPTMTPVGFPD